MVISFLIILHLNVTVEYTYPRPQVNFYFNDGDNKHVCEVQLMHYQMMMQVRVRP